MSRPAVAYYRVSTARQGASGLGLEAQQAAVEAHCRHHQLDLARAFTEVETGTWKRQRNEILRAIEASRELGATLVIAKLDRLARNVAFISRLMESGVDFVAVDVPEANRLTVHILAAIAEHEAELISKRTTEALAAAKARGVELGTPENLTQEARVLGARARREAAVTETRRYAHYIRTLRGQNYSLRQIAARLNEDGFTTRQGKRWHAMQVKRVLDRHQEVQECREERAS